jgi:hypothetical protein
MPGYVDYVWNSPVKGYLSVICVLLIYVILHPYRGDYDVCNSAHLSKDIYRIFLCVIDVCISAHLSRDVYRIFVCVLLMYAAHLSRDIYKIFVCVIDVCCPPFTGYLSDICVCY